MKSYKEIEKKHSPEEIAESLVFPGPKDPVKREKMLSALREVRKQQKENQSEESKLISQLLQLKFLMEDYLKADSFNKNFYFGYFLNEYIARLEKKKKAVCSGD
ncbi:hypothetical protein HF329_05960 [Chitinophaga oryzae]|uniref:Uncharacterized protein n=1 Tax=Chitinophaga oryzae TaxID=2725414 RepID=A0AAE7D677_9BACT|nr:hypothetical protein [Chitinophaga oryzae]QJB30869.1 hypothetical protein HF329_05960 [Chitinophaga oryzae]